MICQILRQFRQEKRGTSISNRWRSCSCRCVFLASIQHVGLVSTSLCSVFVAFENFLLYHDSSWLCVQIDHLCRPEAYGSAPRIWVPPALAAPPSGHGGSRATPHVPRKQTSWLEIWFAVSGYSAQLSHSKVFQSTAKSQESRTQIKHR